MADSTIDITPDAGERADAALDGIAGVAPAEQPDGGAEPLAGTRETSRIREGADATTVTELERDPTDADAKLHVELDETFPGSDAPSTTRPGSSDPAPSSGYNEAAEQARAHQR
jgi:hypothetical protein